MKYTKLKVEIVYGVILSKDSFSLEQTNWLNNFLAKIMWKLIFV